MKKGRKLITGDIHGARKALDQCLERCNFDYENDTLIQLGDVADGWDEVYDCVEKLLSIKSLISIKGNHDAWFYQWIINEIQPAGWLQGGYGTLKSYCRKIGDYKGAHIEIRQTMSGYFSSLRSADLPQSHIDFFKNQLLYYIDEDNNCFVHGGFNRHATMVENKLFDEEQFYWDRDLWMACLSFKQISQDQEHVRFKMVENFKEVFIGHTATMSWGTIKPMHSANVWNLDTGAGFKGRLTIMDLDSHQYWQSDLVQELYPDQTGRNR